MSDLITTEGSFEWAMLQLKEGKRVAREGWNGKGMYLLRNPGLMAQSVQDGDYRAQAGVEVGTEFDFLPNIEMCNADGNFVPWVSSQYDVKASDWILIHDWKYMLIFDMTSGHKDNSWGYIKNYSVGECEVVEDNINITSVHSFRYSGNLNDWLVLNLLCSDNPADHDHFFDGADLQITINDKSFTLPCDLIQYHSGRSVWEFNCRMDSNHEIITIMKTLGKKQRYSFNWVRN